MPDFMQIDEYGNMPNIMQIYEYKAGNIFLLVAAMIGVWYPASKLLRKNHATEIYAVWYIYSFFLLLFTGLGFVAERQNKHIPELCGSYQDICKTIYDALTSIEDEVILVVSFAALAIIPQILTYFLCGFSGTASTPRYVSQIHKIAAWSLVKFMAGLGGITSAAFFAKLAAGNPADLKNLSIGFGTATAGFLYAAIHTGFTEVPIWPHLLSKMGAGNPLVRVHKFFTRNVPEEPPARPHSLKRRALIAMLESDAVYDYLTQDEKNT